MQGLRPRCIVSIELDPPSSAKCHRCGYCCKEWGYELPFTEEDENRWQDEDWFMDHPFIDWDLRELLNPGGIGCENRKEARAMLREAEHSFEEKYGPLNGPYPWGGTMWGCLFLKWMGNKWGCLLHGSRSLLDQDMKPKICREYNCYWDRLEAGFKWLFD